MKRLLTICAVAAFLLAVSATAQAALVAQWMLDDGAGTTASDSSGNSHHGTLTNMAGTEWVGGALHFDGLNDYVRVIPPPAFPAISGAITIAMCVNADAIENSKILLWKSNNYGLATDYTVVGGAPGTFGFTIYSGGWRTVNSTTLPVAGTWYHVAGTYDGIALRIYVNGALENTLLNPGLIYSTPHSGYPDVYFGGHALSPGPLAFDGLLDETCESMTTRCQRGKLRPWRQPVGPVWKRRSPAGRMSTKTATSM